MEQSDKKAAVIKPTKEGMLELVREYDKSQGMTIKAYCRLHQISEGSFYSARSHYRSPGSATHKPTGFIAIAPPAFKESSGTLFAEVGGIKLYQAVPAEYLKELVI